MLLAASFAGRGVEASVVQNPVQTTEATARFLSSEYRMGSPDAPVTVIEYFSDTCTHCAAFNTRVFPIIRSKYVVTGRVQYIYREAPTAPVVVSSAGFLLARCAGEAGYLPAVDAIFSRQGYVLDAKSVEDGIGRLSEVLQLDISAVQVCLGRQEDIDRLNERMSAAQAAGVDGTPTFFFNGKRLAPGDRLAGTIYEGGELTLDQFDFAFERARRAVSDHRSR